MLALPKRLSRRKPLIKMRSGLTVALGAALLVGCGSSPSPSRSLSLAPSGFASSDVADHAAFCRGVGMEQAKSSDADEIKALGVMRDATRGSLHDAITFVLGGFSTRASQDVSPQWQAAASKIQTAALSVCNVDLQHGAGTTTGTESGQTPLGGTPTAAANTPGSTAVAVAPGSLSSIWLSWVQACQNTQNLPPSCEGTPQVPRAVPPLLLQFCETLTPSGFGLQDLDVAIGMAGPGANAAACLWRGGSLAGGAPPTAQLVIQHLDQQASCANSTDSQCQPTSTGFKAVSANGNTFGASIGSGTTALLAREVTTGGNGSDAVDTMIALAIPAFSMQ